MAKDYSEIYDLENDHANRPPAGIAKCTEREGKLWSEKISEILRLLPT